MLLLSLITKIISLPSISSSQRNNAHWYTQTLSYNRSASQEQSDPLFRNFLKIAYLERNSPLPVPFIETASVNNAGIQWLRSLDAYSNQPHLEKNCLGADNYLLHYISIYCLTTSLPKATVSGKKGKNADFFNLRVFVSNATQTRKPICTMWPIGLQKNLLVFLTAPVLSNFRSRSRNGRLFSVTRLSTEKV